MIFMSVARCIFHNVVKVDTFFFWTFSFTGTYTTGVYSQSLYKRFQGDGLECGSKYINPRRNTNTANFSQNCVADTGQMCL